MFSPQVVELAYIGNRPTKTDNVCGTGTVWIGFGDIQKVERKHIPVFLKHPDVWMLGDKFRELQGISEPLTGGQIGGVHEVLGDLSGIGAASVGGAPLVPAQDITSQYAIKAQTDSAPVGFAFVDGAPIVSTQVMTELKTDSAPEVVGVQSGLSDALQLSNAAAIKLEGESPAEKPEEEKSEKSGDQLAAIKNAILSLEQGNDKHFSSTNGVPVVSAVRNAAGDESITAAEVRAAWAELNGKAV